MCKLAAAGIIPVFFFFFPRCVVLVEMESVLVHCSAATLPRPRPRGRTRRRHTQVRAATDWAPTHCCLPASSLFLVLDRKNQMVMDGMDNRVRSAIMPLCLPFSGREERTWLWPLGLGGRECVCRWTVVPPSVSFSAVLCCAPWRRRVSRLWVMATCTAPPPRKVGKSYSDARQSTYHLRATPTDDMPGCGLDASPQWTDGRRTKFRRGHMVRD